MNKKDLLIRRLGILILFVVGVNFIGISQEDRTIKFEEGMIISSESVSIRTEPYVTKESYDPFILGVYHVSPNDVNDAVTRTNPFKKDGIVYVRYNSSNGQIRKGDAITSSNIPGEGMKATESGMIVGVALEDAKEKEGLIKTRIMIQYNK